MSPAGARRTNLSLLALTVAAIVSGTLAFAIGGSWVRWAAVAHGVAGIGIVLLAPWKTTIAARGVRRRRERSLSSVVLAALVVVVVATGVDRRTVKSKAGGSPQVRTSTLAESSAPSASRPAPPRGTNWCSACCRPITPQA